MVEIPWEGGKRGARISDSANGSTHKLTSEIDRLSYEYASVKYNDLVRDRAAQAGQTALDIRNGNIGYISDFLSTLISDSMREKMTDITARGIAPDDSASIQTMRKAQELLNRLAEKKAEIAEKGAKSHETEKTKKPPGMGMDDSN